MHITIENNKIIVNLDETEFPIFEAMFANLQDKKSIILDFRRFPNYGGITFRQIHPMHLCRVIGEGRHGPTAGRCRRNTRLLLKDPPSADVTVKVNLSRDRILAAARSRAYREKIFGDITTLFRHEGKTIKLERVPFVEKKHHGWLNIG